MSGVKMSSIFLVNNWRHSQPTKSPDFRSREDKFMYAISHRLKLDSSNQPLFAFCHLFPPFCFFCIFAYLQIKKALWVHSSVSISALNNRCIENQIENRRTKFGRLASCGPGTSPFQFHPYPPRLAINTAVFIAPGSCVRFLTKPFYFCLPT